MTDSAPLTASEIDVIAVTSQATRRLIGRIDSGEDVVANLNRITDLQSITAGEIRFSGLIRGVEIARHVNGGYQSLDVSADAEFEIIQGSALIAQLGNETVLKIEVQLSTFGPTGQQFVFGQLRSAEAMDVEFIIDVFEDVSIKRQLDSDSGRLIIESVSAMGTEAPPVRERKTPERIAEAKLQKKGKAEKPAVKKVEISARAEPLEADKVSVASEEKPPSSAWKSAMKASDDMEPEFKRVKRKTTKLGPQQPDDDSDDSELMRPGDIINHPKLGKCRIVRIEQDEFAHIRLARGQIRKLALTICEITWVDEDDGRNIFDLRIRK